MKKIKNIVKKLIKNIVIFFVKFISKFKIGIFILQELNEETNNQTKEIIYKDINLKFHVPNQLNFYRVDSFYYKEPETIEWINNFEENSIFWDIGSNIGLFSCYAASKKNCKVYSFEPSVFNLEILCKNINLNKLNDQITVFSLPLTENIKESKFKLSSLEKGSALSTFGEDFTYDGTKINSIFDYKTVGISINEIVRYLKFTKPDYIKIDVDGIEHLILSGGKDVLISTNEILVEVDEKFDKQFNLTSKILINAGFKLFKKVLIQNTKRQKSEKQIFNQIWKK
jgi:FkbM family methyltransferase